MGRIAAGSNDSWDRWDRSGPGLGLGTSGSAAGGGVFWSNSSDSYGVGGDNTPPAGRVGTAGVAGRGRGRSYEEASAAAARDNHAEGNCHRPKNSSSRVGFSSAGVGGRAPTLSDLGGGRGRQGNGDGMPTLHNGARRGGDSGGGCGRPGEGRADPPGGDGGHAGQPLPMLWPPPRVCTVLRDEVCRIPSQVVVR